MTKPSTKKRVRGLGKAVLARELQQFLSGTTLGLKLNTKEIEFVLKLVVQTIRMHVMQKERISLAGFGSFWITERKGRILTQKGGNRIEVPNYRIIRFKASGQLRKVINGKTCAPVMVIPTDLRLLSKKKRTKKPPVMLTNPQNLDKKPGRPVRHAVVGAK